MLASVEKASTQLQFSGYELYFCFAPSTQKSRLGKSDTQLYCNMPSRNMKELGRHKLSKM
jgi:hypothetical protein